MPFEVSVKEPVHQPGREGVLSAPGLSSCSARYTPTYETNRIQHHWDVSCEPLEDTKDLLSVSAKDKNAAGEIQCNAAHEDRLRQLGRICAEPSP